MNFLNTLDTALKAASKGQEVKTAAQQSAEETIKKTASNDRMTKLAEDAHSLGRIAANGFLGEIRKQAQDSFNKQALGEGGHVSGGTINEPGSVTQQANSLPVNVNSPGKKIDESKKVKHLTEQNLTTPGKTEVAQALVNKVSK